MSSSYRDNNHDLYGDPLAHHHGGGGPVLYDISVDDDQHGNTRMTKMGSSVPTTSTTTTRRRSPWCNQCFCGILLVGVLLLVVAVPLSMSGINNSNAAADAAAEDAEPSVPSASSPDYVDGNGSGNGSIPDFVGENGDFDIEDGPGSEDILPDDGDGTSFDDGSAPLDPNTNRHDFDAVISTETVKAADLTTTTAAPPDDGRQPMMGYDGMPSPIATQVDFGHKVAMSAEGWRIAVASSHGGPEVDPEALPGGSALQGLVHVFKHNHTWLYEQTLAVAMEEDNDTGIAPPISDISKFHPALDMSDDGLRVAFSTPQNSVAVFVKLSKMHGYKWRQLGPSITLAHAFQNGNAMTDIDSIHVVDVALSGNGEHVAVFWCQEDAAAVQIYQDVETTNFSDQANPVIDNWVFKTEIKLPSSSRGTLSFSFTGHELAVGQHARTKKGEYGEQDVVVPAVVSVWTVDKSDPTESVWLPAGDAMIDGISTPAGSEFPYKLGGIVHLSSDGTTLAVGGMVNSVTVLRRQDAEDEGETPANDVGALSVDWKRLGMGDDGHGVIHGSGIHSKFGSSVHLNRYGTRLVVGAPGSPELLNNTNLASDLLPFTYGQVNVYEFYDSGPQIPHWKLVTNAAGSHGTYRSETQSDNFGQAVCIDEKGDKVIVGAPHAASLGAVTVVNIGKKIGS